MHLSSLCELTLGACFNGLALIGLEISDGSDSPPALMAVTLYSYSFNG